MRRLRTRPGQLVAVLGLLVAACTTSGTPETTGTITNTGGITPVSLDSVMPEQVAALETMPHQLYTHCGIEYTELDGAFWLADIDERPLLQYQTTMQWTDPLDDGTLSVLSDGSTMYLGNMGLVMRFLPAPPGYEPPGCY